MMYQPRRYPSKLSEEELAELPTSMRSKIWDPGFVYLIDFGDGKQFKIGKTANNPSLRLDAIVKGANLIYPIPSDAKLVFYAEISTSCYYLEQLLHMEYAKYNTSGEWFEFEGWIELSDAAHKLDAFGIVTYTDRWFELIPKDWKEYVEHGVIPPNLNYEK